MQQETDDQLVVSTAELAMERLGLQGTDWYVPRTRYDDPNRFVLHGPVNEFIRQALIRDGLDPQWANDIEVRPCCWQLRDPSSGMAVTDGLTYIGLAGEAANSMTLLHECAHILTQNPDERHRLSFQRIAERLYNRHISAEAGAAFRRHLDAAKRTLGILTAETTGA